MRLFGLVGILTTLIAAPALASVGGPVTIVTIPPGVFDTQPVSPSSSPSIVVEPSVDETTENSIDRSTATSEPLPSEPAGDQQSGESDVGDEVESAPPFDAVVVAALVGMAALLASLLFRVRRHRENDSIGPREGPGPLERRIRQSAADASGESASATETDSGEADAGKFDAGDGPPDVAIDLRNEADIDIDTVYPWAGLPVGELSDSSEFSGPPTSRNGHSRR
jgi:hypothetical protein